MYYLRHAWEKTHSIWGKACIVLFYSFLWVNIVWSLAVAIDPWLVCECTAAHTPESEAFAGIQCVRVINVFAVGFFLLADRGGIHLWNVAMVFVINSIASWPLLALATHYKPIVESDADCTASLQSLQITTWAMVVWSALALVASFLDARQETSTNAGTTGERTPLV
ncbi:hypothetical protein ACA910_013862 [Epithemia clementina (nom. ined.)]